MENEHIKLCNGKYEVIRSEDYKTFKALRYGKAWRDLTGDNLIAALCDEIIELRNKQLNNDLK